MAKVTIAGNSYVVTSEVSMADLETVKKYRPSALAIVDPETKETLFKVGIGSSVGTRSVNDFNISFGSIPKAKVSGGSGSVNDFGISFGGVSNCADKLATATLSIPADVEDAKEYVLDVAGLAVANLNKVEAGIAEALEEIRAERNTISENIDVIV